MTATGRPPYPHLYQINLSDGGVPKRPVLEAVITTTGVEGDRLQIGPDVQIEIMSYTIPCDQNAQWFRDRDYKRVSQKKNPGWSRFYAKVLREGVVRPGDAVEILEMSR